jgi:nigerose phosphorylase
LSACAYAMVATEFGNLDFAYKYFLKTAKIDLEAKYKVYVGTSSWAARTPRQTAAPG